jgi:ABC-type transporter lipoprotein component MlaA
VTAGGEPLRVAGHAERRFGGRGGLRSVVLLGVLALLGCTTSIETKRRDWSQYTGPGAEYFRREEVPFVPLLADPLEPTNRGTHSFNDWTWRYVLEPIGKGWRFIFPEPVRKHMRMFGTNLAFPVRGVNNLVQGEFSAAGTELLRFLINTTVGLLGFFDPADSWGIEAPPPEDTGLSLKAAGWDDPNYVVLPVVGPSDTRDAVGSVPDILLNIGFWIPFPVLIVLGMNRASDLTPKYERFAETSDETYQLLHILYSVQRAAEQLRFMAAPAPESAAIETLQAVFFKPTDPGFVGQGETSAVTIPSTGRELPYTLWLQPQPAPIVFIVPGTGSHRLSNHATASAEWAWQAGCSAVTISNTMNFEFFRNASSVDLPGYEPVDAHDTHVALDLIARDIETKHPGQMQTKGLLGLSLGAMHTLFIAAAESDPANTLVRFDGYYAGASPVRLEHAIKKIDEFYEAPLALPPGEREQAMLATLNTALKLGESGDLAPGEPLPIGQKMAEYLIGLSFRITLMDILWDTQSRQNMGVLLTPLVDDERGPAYAEMADYSFMEYFYAFLLPYYTQRDPSLTDRAMFEACSLRSIEAPLRANTRIHVFTNREDWLQSDEDRAWQESVFGDRITIWPSGGHMGNTITPEAREAVVHELQQLREPQP